VHLATDARPSLCSCLSQCVWCRVRNSQLGLKPGDRSADMLTRLVKCSAVRMFVHASVHRGVRRLTADLPASITGAAAECTFADKEDFGKYLDFWRWISKRYWARLYTRLAKTWRLTGTGEASTDTSHFRHYVMMLLQCIVYRADKQRVMSEAEQLIVMPKARTSAVDCRAMLGFQTTTHYKRHRG